MSPGTSPLAPSRCKSWGRGGGRRARAGSAAGGAVMALGRCAGKETGNFVLGIPCQLWRGMPESWDYDWGVSVCTEVCKADEEVLDSWLNPSLVISGSQSLAHCITPGFILLQLRADLNLASVTVQLKLCNPHPASTAMA